MAKVFFLNVTPRVSPGGVITGTLVVESERPIDPSVIRVDLAGAETAFVLARNLPHRPTGPIVPNPAPSGFHFGPDGRRGGEPARQSLEETQSFLKESVDWSSGGHVAGAFYRLPFSFPIPPGSLPSLRTGDTDYVASRVHREPSFGMFVEYTLVGRVHHPMWADHVEYQVVHVVPPRGPIGFAPNLRLDDGPRALTLMVNPMSPAVTPGAPLTGFFQILNPQSAKIATLSVALVRRVVYSARGVGHMLEGPRFEQEIPIPHHDEKCAGQFSLAVADDLDTIPPMRGAMFESQWLFCAQLKGGLLSAPLAVEAPVGAPPSAPPPP